MKPKDRPTRPESADCVVVRLVLGFHPGWLHAGFQEILRRMCSGMWGAILQSGGVRTVKLDLAWRNALPHAMHVVQRGQNSNNSAVNGEDGGIEI